MTAIVPTSTTQSLPNPGVKRVIIRTDSAAATGHTYDATDVFTDIWATYLCDDTGAVKIATWSTLTVTLGTISTGVHTLIIEGI